MTVVCFLICPLNLVQISRSRREWPTVADVGQVTSCELTSGSVFGNVGISVLHVSTKFCANITIEILAFNESKMAAVYHLGFVGRSRRTTHEGPFTVAIPWKFFVMIGIVVLKLWVFYFFVVRAWKSYSWARISRFLWFNSKNLGEDPQRHVELWAFVGPDRTHRLCIVYILMHLPQAKI